jgi:hypothetical protein
MEKPSNRSCQGGRFEGFEDHTGGSERSIIFRLMRSAKPRHKNNGHARLHIYTESGQCSYAAHSRHNDVEKNYVGPPVRCNSQGFWILESCNQAPELLRRYGKQWLIWILSVSSTQRWN